MELKIYSQTKTEAGKQKLPKQFSEEVRPDLIKKAFLALKSQERQPYGADPMAGQKVSAKLSRRRRDYKGSYGLGISRSPRKILSRKGTRFNWVGAFAPNTVGGRRAHPPKSLKIWAQKINKEENKKAIRSAMAATVIKESVQERCHKVPKEYPFIVDDKFESLDKTSKIIGVLVALGFNEDLERAERKIVRAGIGKMRGRKYRRKKSLLIVVAGDCKALKAARNIPGVNVVRVNDLNVDLLAPGAVPGRITLFTHSSILRLEKEHLFM